MKYAVYVEGLSELLFVSDVLQKYSNYDPGLCGFRCINLNADDFENLPYPIQGDESSQNYYQIVNVNNDNRVISKLNQDISGLIRSGFSIILGLKDVYGEAYEQISGGTRIVDPSVINHLYSIQAGAIKTNGSDCRLHFAIMEYEAWMLALIGNYVESKGSSLEELSTQLGVELTMDPETTIYHPYSLARQIYKFFGEDYHKHGKESYSFLSSLTRDDYERLRWSGRCASFAKFLDSLLGGAPPNLP